LTVTGPAVLADLFSLMVHLKPAPVVARVATCMPKLRSPIEESLRAEIDVTTYLAAQGAPVVRPSDELPAGPHNRDGFAITFWTYLEADPERTPTTQDCSAMLVELHSVLRGYPKPVPALGVRDIAEGLRVLGLTSGVVTDEEAKRLRAVADRLGPFMAAPGGDVQVLHGDAHPGNVVATRNGLVWIDFEDVCRGPVEWDLASMMDAGAIGGYHRPDPEILARCKELRTLQVVLALIAFHEEFGDLDGWEDAIHNMLGGLA
jgi:Ser/Thr protein kinase RdoA (MazF antagonist)